MKLYENVFTAKGRLYVREYDTETKLSETKQVSHVQDLFIPTKEETEFKSIITKGNLRKISFKSVKEYNDEIKRYKDTGIRVYGISNRGHDYIRENYGDPIDNDHPFRTMFIDIETAILDKDTPKDITRNDWKPEGPRAAMAVVTSIQMYDTKSKTFFILGLKKDWKDKDTYKTEHGKVHYIKCETEESLLKNFLKILNKINPTVLAGWNSEGYDYPYLTMRIIRVLDGVENLFDGDKFNTEALNGDWVKQLSPVGLVTYRPDNTNYGIRHTFKWVGYILEDYQELFKKYTYTTLTSYSLSSAAQHELGSDKVNHDEFTDFADFYLNNFNLFIEYGIQDIILLIELNNKLKLIDLAKFLAYHCGVTMDDVRGTIKQWITFVYNEAYKNRDILPLENEFPDVDDVLLKHAITMSDLDEDRKKHFEKLLKFQDENGNYTLRGQRFPGGWTRGTSRFWKWVFSLDFTSLYPSAQMWANIGIDTLIEPKDLPKELLDLRAKYFIYYSKDTDPKELERLDYEFITNVLEDPKKREEIHNVLVKYNVSATPNGMFFRKDKQSTMSTIIENLIVKRKTFKKDMKRVEAEIETLKSEKDKLLKMLS